jgi:acetyl coenzyme A synthetase (ADP forming)-like protein
MTRTPKNRPNPAQASEQHGWRQGPCFAKTVTVTKALSGEDPFGHVLLKDGSAAALRPSCAADWDLMRQFFHAMSPDNRHQRFFAAGEPSADLVARFCDSDDPARALTLVATRTVDGATRFIGVGSFIRTDETTAEIAFAVDDRYHGRGIATALLERLGVEAVRHGIRAFRAETLPDNSAMLAVFRDSGYHVRSAGDRDSVDVEFSLAPTDASVSASDAREKANATASIVPLLRPRAVAVIGVSREPRRIGRRVFDALLGAGFRGPVYPINPKADDVGGVPAFPSVRDVPGPVDLAVIAVPRDAVLQAVDECAAAGVKAVVVVTAGFAEAGDEGRLLQQQLTEKVRGFGMRMVGPNCMGVLNADPALALNASFSPIFPSPGHLALSSQSGALGVVILALANRRHVGLSSFVSVGNRADVSSNDLLQFWESDPATSVIAFYLESFGNPARFARLARRVGRTKPIIAVKSGRTRAGSRAAGSHTAALAAADVAVDALFRQTGVIRADTIDEMFDLAACLVAQPLPAGRRVAIVTNAGGPGILAADACEAAGLSVVELTEETRRRLSAFLPPAASMANPVDMVASAGPAEYRATIETVLAASEVDALIIAYTPVDTPDAQHVLAAIVDGVVSGRALGGAGKPVAACLMAAHDLPLLQAGSERIPVYAFPENAVRALGKIAGYAEWRAAPIGLACTFDDIDADAVRALCQGVIDARGEDWLTPAETTRVLASCHLPIPEAALARSAGEAVSTAERIGFPVAAKLVSSQATHKTELGGVRLGLVASSDVAAAFEALAAIAGAHRIAFDGVLVQAMAGPGVETMVGLVHDPLFGPLLGFGLGGTEVEVLGDVRFRVTPVTDRDIDDLIAQTRASVLLAGYRGRPAADVAGVRSLLSRVSWLADQVPEILELDLNPVIVKAAGEGCVIVDARIKVGGVGGGHSV